MLLLAMAAVSVLACAGCGGINANQSVSPASFFLPGLMKADSPSTNMPVALPEPSEEVALTR